MLVSVLENAEWGPKVPPQRKSKLIGYFLPNEWGREAKKKLIEK